ncbi:MAG: hypothetical protein HYS60_01785 [Candidatus Wildermuthbacteria bacterium]|nr:hypothetical protein [Candidatus Wildermuthbacteria bacterium]
MEEQKPTNQEPEGEMLDLLKRGEVRTMAKDVAEVREETAKQEFGRIGATAPQTLQPVSPAGEPSSFMPASPAGAIPSAPERPSSKTLPRILIALFVIAGLGAGGFFAYQSFLRKEPAPSAVQTPEQAPESEQAIPETPAPLLQTSYSSTIEVAGGVAALEDFLSQDHQKGLTAIQLANEAQQPLNLQDFFATFGMQVPENISSLLRPNFTFFLSVSNAGNKRLGFVLKTASNFSISDLLEAWEPAMERDFALLSSPLGPKNKFYVSFFRQSQYQGVPVRYQTFSDQDFGIVYAQMQDFLIFTTSFESARNVIDALLLNQ